MVSNTEQAVRDGGQVALFFFGPPRIVVGGQEREGVGRKAIALLAYLAATGQPHSREALATLLWPESRAEQSRANLRNVIWVLNQTLGEGWLAVERSTLELPARPDLWVDVARFAALRAALGEHGHARDALCPRCLAPLREAAGLYSDAFLAGFTLSDSAAWDEWHFFQREGLQQQLRRVLDRLARLHGEAGRWADALPPLQRLLLLDPLDEETHRRLMQCYAWAGQRAAALRQYETCRRILDEELSVPPLETTTGLYQSIRSGEVGPRHSTGPAMVMGSVPVSDSPRLPPSPLVGRAEEWRVLRAAYQEAAQAGRVVALTGEAGIGKTRLAEAWLDEARGAGARIATGRAYEGEMGLAYGPFVGALQSALAGGGATLDALPEPVLADLSRLLPALDGLRPGLPPPPPLDNPLAQSRFFESMRHLLTGWLEGEQPGVLFLDDLHWADRASLELLSYLVHRLAGSRLLILLAWRNEQPPLHRLLAAARQGGQGATLPLRRLDQEAVTVLLQGRGGNSLAERLFQETEGLPFFLVAYLDALDQRQLSAGEAGWGLPGGVRELLRARLSGVSEMAHQLLQSAAVIGRSSEFDLLREASGRSEEETIQGLEALEAAGLIEESEATQALHYGFTHEKLREFVYDEMGGARRRLLHRRVADALSRRTHGTSVAALASRIAHHFWRGGQDEQAARAFKQAGEHARALYANAEALAHFQQALALQHPDQSALQEAIGDMQRLLGRYSEALASYHEAARARPARAHGPLCQKRGDLHARRGEWPQAEAGFQAAAALADPAQLPGLYAEWSLIAHRQGEPARARELAEQALQHASASGKREGLARAHNILGILARGEQAWAQAQYHLTESLALGDGDADPAARIAALNNLSRVLQAQGEVERAIALAGEALALCQSLGDQHLEAALHSNLADLLHASGQPEAVFEHLAAAARIYAAIGRDEAEWRPEIWKLAEW